MIYFLFSIKSFHSQKYFVAKKSTIIQKIIHSMIKQNGEYHSKIVHCIIVNKLLYASKTKIKFIHHPSSGHLIQKWNLNLQSGCSFTTHITHTIAHRVIYQSHTQNLKNKSASFKIRGIIKNAIHQNISQIAFHKAILFISFDLIFIWKELKSKVNLL